MKMTKKFLFAAAAAAVLVGFTACAIGDIQWKDKGSGTGTQVYEVEQKNENTYTIRGMKPVGILDRAQSTCVVTQKNQTSSSCDGMVGFASYVKKNDNGTMNFLVVGVRNNSGTIETYASFFCNIDPDKLSTQNFGASKTLTKYTESETDPYEVIILDLPSDTDKEGLLTGAKIDANKKLKIAIDFSMDNEGNIAINWYDTYKTTAASTAAASISFDGINPLKTKTATKEQLGTNVLSKAGKVYAYANIYANQTLSGRWEFYNLSMKKDDASRFAEDGLPLEVGEIIFKEL